MVAPRKGPSYWDRISRQYDSLYARRYSTREDDELRTWLEEAIVGGGRPRVLDIGCGTGLGLTLLTGVASQFSYACIDISTGMISQFRSKMGDLPNGIDVELRVGDAKNMSQHFAKRSFDLVMLLNAAASYVGTPSRLLRQARSMLTENGVLFASFLNRHSLRRIIHGQCRAAETYNTRGADEELMGVKVITISRRQLELRCSRVGLNPRWIKFQSVFGGVLEAEWAAPVEKGAAKWAPVFGHTVNLLAANGVRGRQKA